MVKKEGGGKEEEISNEDSLEQQPNLEKPIVKNYKDIIMENKKLKRKNNQQLMDQKNIQCPECLKKKKDDPNHKVRTYASIPSLYTHLDKKHDTKIVPQELKPPKCHNNQAQRGRPKNQVDNNVKVTEMDIVEIDDEMDKIQVLKYFENQYFMKVLHSVMFTDGYLSRDEHILMDKPLSSNQIISQFQELAQMFKYSHYSKDMISQNFLDGLQFISSLVINEAFIFIFYALFNKGYEELFKFAQKNKQKDTRFDIVFGIIEKETASKELTIEFVKYFESLHNNLNILRKQL